MHLTNKNSFLFYIILKIIICFTNFGKPGYRAKKKKIIIQQNGEFSRGTPVYQKVHQMYALCSMEG